jgi:hypothetical protein
MWYFNFYVDATPDVLQSAFVLSSIMFINPYFTIPVVFSDQGRLQQLSTLPHYRLLTGLAVWRNNFDGGCFIV